MTVDEGGRSYGGGGTSQTTRVAPGSRVKGEITGGAQVSVEGEMEGTVSVDGSVVVERDGRLKGDVEANTVQISGEIVGNVRGRVQVEVSSSGRVRGDVEAPRVSIAAGGFLQGQVNTVDDAKSGAGSSTPPGLRSREASG